MALKFLNKKGWHTGSLRNIENVWKAEQKHDAEQKKLEELRKQIHEERERSEFRQLQEQAGLVPRQERLDFLYESGLAVGKNSEGFKALEAPPAATATASASASAEASSSKAAVPGALFEDKPQSANDAWRKLHTDPLLLIRQREQEALARIKNNPVQMAMIRKSVEAEKKPNRDDKGKQEKKKHKRKHHHKLKSEKNSDSENTSGSEEDRKKRNHLASNMQKHSKRKHSSKDSSEDEGERRKSDQLASDRHKDRKLKHEKHSSRVHSDSRYSSESEEDRRKSDRLASDRHKDRNLKHENHSSRVRSDSRFSSESEEDRRKSDRLASDRHKDKNLKHENHSSRVRSDSRYSNESEEDRKKSGRSASEHHSRYSHSRHPSMLPGRDEERRKHVPSTSERNQPSSEPDADNKNKEVRAQNQQGPGYNRRKGVPKMTEEEREARLREMQLDAELHEEQRWKRIKKAAEADAQEAARASSSRGKNFLDAAQKSIYGTEKGGSSTIEESVRRRAYYSQGGTADHESNAFRR